MANPRKVHEFGRVRGSFDEHAKAKGEPDLQDILSEFKKYQSEIYVVCGEMGKFIDHLMKIAPSSPETDVKQREYQVLCEWKAQLINRLNEMDRAMFLFKHRFIQISGRVENIKDSGNEEELQDLKTRMVEFEKLINQMHPGEKKKAIPLFDLLNKRIMKVKPVNYQPLIIIRVQSSEGTKRIQIQPMDSVLNLFEKVYETFELDDYSFALYRERSHKNELPCTQAMTIIDAGLSHGDMIYVVPLSSIAFWPSEQNIISRPSTSNSDNSQFVEPMEEAASQSTRVIPCTEDDVDIQLRKMNGEIQRTKDEKLCHHGINGHCIHCIPIAPYDEAYLKQQSIKHLSFHSFLKKLTAGVDQGKFVSLEDISCRIKPGCKDHPPWPKGICSKCQPNAITLDRQTYRHVDNVMFENPHLVERFLNYWRTTGHQRIGFLYGKYEIHTDVPLGIRATVAAIYEPPQESTPDSISLLPDDKAPVVEELAQKLGLRRVGWIFTDLVAEDITEGTVQHIRNIDTHFLSAEECIMSGHYQNQHPNACRFSPVGHFGSKFVTVCVTGDVSNQVHMEGYQVSNQCMALVRENCLVPTNVPGFGYVTEASDKQYVPDVFYKEKDSYGNEVSRLARPLPVEYLLVDVPASTPLSPLYTFFTSPDIQPFPVENRLVDGHIQDFSGLSTYIQQFSSEQFINAASDFHFLLYIATMDMVPVKEILEPLLEAVKTKNSVLAAQWCESEHWQTVKQLIDASSPENAAQNEPGENSPPWTCSHCTYNNPSHVINCDMCGLPKP